MGIDIIVTYCNTIVIYPPRSSCLVNLLFIHSVLSDTLWPHGLHTAGFPVLHHLQGLLKLMSIELVIPSNHLILCHPLLLLLSIFLNIRIFFNESDLCIRWPKYWSFSFSISPSNEYSRLISFRIDCFNLIAIQRTLNSLLHNHSSKATIPWCSVFFMIHLSHRYMITGKTIALTRPTLVGKVMSLLFNMLSRLVITFLPRSKHLLISRLQSLHAVVWRPRK